MMNRRYAVDFIENGEDSMIRVIIILPYYEIVNSTPMDIKIRITDLARQFWYKKTGRVLEDPKPTITESWD